MRVTFKNFRCLKQTELILSPLTVIAGANASGKTSILRALDPSMQVFHEDVWQRRPGLGASVERGLDNGQFIRSFFRNAPGIESSGSSYSYQYLRLELDHLRAANQVQEERRLSEKGANLTNVFASLSRSNQSKVAAEFCRLVPVFSDVDATPFQAGQHRLQMRSRSNLRNHSAVPAMFGEA